MLKYLVIIAAIFAAALSGAFIVDANLNWYSSLNFSPEMPRAEVFGMAWTFIFLLIGLSATILWTLKLRGEKAHRRRLVAGMFIANGFLNVLWSSLFFGLHNVALAFAEIFLLNATIIALILLIWPINKISASLLVPYTVWVTYASYLNYMVLLLN